MPRFILGNLRTGRRILDLPVLTSSWNDRLLAPESITVTTDLNDPDAQSLDLRNTSTPAMTFLAVVEGDRILAGGPIWTRNYDADKRTLTLGASGLGSYFNYRHILPLLAATMPVDEWTVTIPDPDNPTETITVANPLLSTTHTNLHLGTIAKKLVQQAELWTGGDLPIAYQGDAAGIHGRTYDGISFKPVLEALDDLANVIDGPEYRFSPRFTPDKLGVEWLFETGDPLIVSPSVASWNVSVPDSPVSGLSVAEDGSVLAGLSWAQGGRQSDTLLIAREEDTTLTDVGFPLMETLDTTHSSVSVQETLDGHAADNLANRVQETWSFTAKTFPTDADGNPAGPQLGQYRVGDYAELVMAPFDAETGMGDPFLHEGGVTRHRIIGLSGDEKGEDVTVTLAPRLED